MRAIAIVILVLFAAWLGAWLPWLRPVSRASQVVVDALLVVAAVRVGFALALLGFGLTPLSLLIPLAMGLGAWQLRPRPSRRTAARSDDTTAS